MNIDEVTCSICGWEHGREETVEIDSTVLCADCGAMQRRATMPMRAPLMLSEEP